MEIDQDTGPVKPTELSSPLEEKVIRRCFGRLEKQVEEQTKDILALRINSAAQEQKIARIESNSLKEDKDSAEVHKQLSVAINNLSSKLDNVIWTFLLFSLSVVLGMGMVLYQTFCFISGGSSG